MARPKRDRARTQREDISERYRDKTGCHVRCINDTSVLAFFGVSTTGFIVFHDTMKQWDWEDSGDDDGFRYLYRDTLTQEEIINLLGIPRTLLNNYRVSFYVVEADSKTHRYAPIVAMRKLWAASRVVLKSAPQGTTFDHIRDFAEYTLAKKRDDMRKRRAEKAVADRRVEASARKVRAMTEQELLLERQRVELKAVGADAAQAPLLREENAQLKRRVVELERKVIDLERQLAASDEQASLLPLAKKIITKLRQRLTPEQQEKLDLALVKSNITL